MMAIRTNVTRLNQAMAEYKKLSGKSLDEVLQKQGGKFGCMLSRAWKGLMPAKGRITRHALERLRGGKGIKVRSRIYEQIDKSSSVETRRTTFKVGKNKHATTRRSKGKRLNFQAEAVRREIAAREKARGFLALTARFGTIKNAAKTSINKWGKTLAKAGVRFGKSPRFIRFVWAEPGEQGGHAADSATTPKALKQVSMAMNALTDDIMVYVQRKYREAAGKAGFR